MALSKRRRVTDAAPLAEINVVPLIDVMLVLLVIFIITAPLLTHSVRLDLPRASSSPEPVRVVSVQVAVDGNRQYFWNGDPVDDAGMLARLRAASLSSPQPELHLRADRETPYERVAWLLSEAAKLGLTRIGFVTDPSREKNSK